MSGLVLNGNTIFNLGEFLPTPYIERFELNGTDSSDNQIKTRINAYLPSEQEQLVYEDGTLINDETSLQNNLSDIKFYVLAFYVNKTVAENLEDDDESFSKRLPIRYYEQIVNNDLNPLEFYHNLSSEINNIRVDGQAPYAVTLFDVTEPQSVFGIENTGLFSGDPQQVFDSNNNEYFLFNNDLTLPITADSWSDIGDLKFIVFSTSIDYYSSTSTFEQDDLNNVDFLNFKISELSYESVFNDGELEPAFKTVFVDSNDDLYLETPLLSIDLAPYKINQITHDDIYDNFTALLDEYDLQYNQDTGFDKLKTMIDNISYILETKRYDSGIVVALNSLANNFPDKTPIKPVGKLYRRFRNKIFAVNNQIRISEKLRRKQIYDSKIYDLRNISVTGDPVNIHVDSDREGTVHYYSKTYNSSLEDQFIYTDWVSNGYTGYYNSEMTVDDVDFRVNFGVFFFDYEKVLRRTTNISKIYDVGKLESWGIPVPYRKFKLELAQTTRYTDLSGLPSSTTSDLVCTFNSNKGYPISEKGYQHQDEYSVLTPDNWASVGPYGPEINLSSYDESNYLSLGFASNVALRSFLDPSNTDQGFGINHGDKIDNYRLMSFQMLDYMQLYGDADGIFELLSSIFVVDNTVDIVNDLIQSCRVQLSRITEYLNKANELCAYNNFSLQFNEYFISEAFEEYGENPGSAPWYVAPLVYFMHEDLIYNTYNGDIDEIKRQALNTCLNINPTNGNLESLQGFVETFETFIDSVYGESGELYTTIERMQNDRICCYVERLL